MASSRSALIVASDTYQDPQLRQLRAPGRDAEELAARLGEPSIFTSAVVQGLRMGEADRDGDQQVSVDELYDFVYEQVRRRTPNQTPGKWSNVEGALFVARNPRPVPPSVALPADLQSAVEDERAWVRAAAVEQLALLLRGPDADLARAARQALTRP